MKTATTNEKTFVYSNGVINVYPTDDGWQYVANAGSKTARTDEHFINWHCAKANAWLAMEKLGVRLK